MSKFVLFFLNKRGYNYGDYGEYSCGGCGACANCASHTLTDVPWSSNSGLFNSCAFVTDMLNASGVAVRMIQVNGEEEISGQILACQPTDVIFEAFFVSPATLNVLTKTYPRVRFFSRNHSEIPFLTQDSNAMSWIAGYLHNQNMHVSTNSARSLNDLRNVAQSYFPHWDKATVENRVVLLPNYHPAAAPLPHIPSPFGVLNVACLGAIRPQKNTLAQAICAIAVARALGKQLIFHINGSRVEHQAGGTIKNLRALFANSPNAKLIEHDWLPRQQFLELCRIMDISMQVSLSETFNIVTADFVQSNVPVVVSPEISWCDERVQASPTNGADIINKTQIALRGSSILNSNRAGLLQYNSDSHTQWLSMFGEIANGYTDRPESFKARPTITSTETHL